MHVQSQETLISDQNLYPPDLVFTQDGAGRYLSFYWSGSERVGLWPQQVVQQMMTAQCGPVNLDLCRSRIRRVLEQGVREQCCLRFCYGGHYQDFEITLSPLIEAAGQPANLVLVMGREVDLPLSEPRLIDTRKSYQWGRNFASFDKLCTQIAWNIRRTLNLDIIWRQAATGLGSALQARHCLTCAYNAADGTIDVMAEYHAEASPTWQGKKLELDNYPCLQQALMTLTPCVIYEPWSPLLPHRPLNPTVTLLFATSYQDQPNGLIVLSQSENNLFLDTFRREAVAEQLYQMVDNWSASEQELICELADQIGTAIAHAKLFKQSSSQAHELQRLNDDLMGKHEELEAAHRQAEEASRMKTEFLANTSHELRTPLNGMIGFLKLVLDELADSPEEEQEFLAEAHRSALLLLDIINDILDVAKIEAGKMELELTSVSLNDLLQDVERKTRSQAIQRNLTLQVQAPSTRDEVLVHGDYQRLLQIMMNLIGNAIKFTPEGAITVSTKIVQQKVQRHSQEFPGYVKVRIADTGIGVSLAQQAKLFRAFSQIDSSRTRQYGGTGLGLVISQKLAEAMGGSVEFFSMGEGLGSTVTCTVPLYQTPVITTTETGSLNGT
ncbi:MAG: ATP-binding protein [Cyanobacteria bacterium P01_H01_bin.121]